MIRHDLTHGCRYRSGPRALRHCDASEPLVDPMARLELAAVHSGGRDHIGGGGRAPAALPRDTNIA